MAAILKSAIMDSAILHKYPHSFILTQLDDGNHLEFCHVGFRHCHHGFRTPCYLLSYSLKNTLHSILTLTQTNSIWLKLIHSHLTWWWQPSCNSSILNLAILDSAIIVFPLKFTHTLPRLVPAICTKKLHLFILTQLVDYSYPEICHPQFNHFVQKKTTLINSHWTWWWQPSWFLPCRIQTLPSWIQTPCYLLSDSLKNTLPPLWPWFKLIQSD